MATVYAAPLIPALPGLTNAVHPFHYNFPAPVQQFAAPAQVAFDAAPTPFTFAAPAFHTNFHYAERPVVVGHNTQVFKSNLGYAPFNFFGHAPVTFAQPMNVVVQKENIVAPVASAPVAPAPAPAVVAPAVIQKHEVVAPVFTLPQVIPHQVVVQQPTKVIVQKIEVPVEVPVSVPAPVREVQIVRVQKEDSRESQEHDSRESTESSD